MKSPEILDDVLWLAIEEASGLWEVLWDLKPKYPTVSEEERFAEASKAVSELVSRGWVEVYRSREPSGALEPVPPSSVGSLLADRANWEEPRNGDTSIRIAATDRGRRKLTRE